MPNAFHNASHFERQRTRRRIRERDIDLALRLGLEHHAAGATFFVLRKCDIPDDLKRDAEVRRAEGTVVVIEDGRISTVYRNRSIRHLFRKPKRSCRKKVHRARQVTALADVRKMRGRSREARRSMAHGEVA